jgi:N utilization substance protein A
VVTEDQQSLAIGKGGQNVRLAAKLTGYRIDIKAIAGDEMEEVAEEENSDSDN